VTVEAVVMGDVGIEVVGKVTDVVGVVATVDVEVDTAVVVDELQDAKISDITMRPVITAQIIALFIYASYYLLILLGSSL